MEPGVGVEIPHHHLSETFYDLNNHTVYTPQPTYAIPAAFPPPHPPPLAPPAAGALWSSSSTQAGDGCDGKVGGYPQPPAGGVRAPKREEGDEQEDIRRAGVKREVSGCGGGGGGVEVGGEAETSERHRGEQHQRRSTPLSGDCLEEDEEGDEENSKDGDRMGDNSCNKHTQVEATLTWLSENYERAEGVCLPRCVLYTHYVDFCKKLDFTAAGPATFGKIIRQKFPKLTTRRLGTRGQSKYHYYGIGIKESSVYYHSVYSGKGLTRFSGVKVKTEGSNRKYSLSSKTGTLLPEFPHVHNLILPDGLSSDKMQTFLMMYRTHCQRILDTIISANFDEVQNLLLHFWQGMPSHLTDILSVDILCDIVSLCDSILYKVLADVLLPSCIQDMPDNLGTEIKVFSRKLPEWLWSALDNVPDCVRDRKMEASRVFARSISRQLSFVHLAQIARATLNSQEEVTRMSADLNQVDFRQILCQAFYTQPSSAETHCDIVMDNFAEFHGLLQKQAPVESYTEWIDSMIDSCVLQPCKDKGEGFRDSAAEFLMQWSLVASLLKKDLTLLNSKSFGSLHLLHMMLDEYVYLVMETQRDQSRDLHLQQQVQRHMKNAEVIKTQAKVRTGSSKMAVTSPKARKRKQDDHPDSADEMEMKLQSHDMKADSTMAGQDKECLVNSSPSSSSYHSHTGTGTGTAFTRPPPSVPRDSLFSQSEDSERLAAPGYPSLPMSPNRSLSSVNGVTSYDRPTYFSQFGHLNTYSDYVGHNASAMTSSRVPMHATDPHTYSQTFPPVSFSAGSGSLSGSYHWGDGRAPTVLADPYSQYGAHGVSSAYDSYKNAALLRGPVYGQEAALGLNAARGYFAARATDTYQGSSLAVAPAYGGNFMEIAPNGAQYPRPEPLPTYQEDLYTSGMAPTLPAFHKHYLASSFR